MSRIREEKFAARFDEIERLYSSYGASSTRYASKRPTQRVAKKLDEIASDDAFVGRLVEHILRAPDIDPGDDQIFAAEAVLHRRKESPCVYRHLCAALSSRSRRTRHKAASLLFTLAPGHAYHAMAQVAARTRDPLVKAVCLQISSMYSANNPSLQRSLLSVARKAVRTRHSSVKMAAYDCLAALGDASDGAIILRAARDKDALIKLTAPDWHRTWSNRHNVKSKL